jgi:pimeloyl-ACP methyl ester carboxylesterase
VESSFSQWLPLGRARTSTLAAEVYEFFQQFAQLGLDVFIYDYRGFGRSSGNTSVRAIVGDYIALTEHLSANPTYSRGFLYGFSFGGIVLTRGLHTGGKTPTAMVLDSVPQAVPWLAFCPRNLDPEANLPADCSNWLVIAGPDDKVVGSRATSFMRTAAKTCGASTKSEPEYGHIFTDSPASTRSRLRQAAEFLRPLVK